MDENYYDLLGVSQYATADDIKCAFRNLAKECHPDTNGGDPISTERFHKIRRAYETLSDSELRHNYNKSTREVLAKKKKEGLREKLFPLETARKLEIILAWSTTRPAFKTSFVCSCLNRMAEGHELTPKQIDSIDNILISFEINIDQWQQDELRNSALDCFVKNQEKTYDWDNFNPEE